MSTPPNDPLVESVKYVISVKEESAKDLAAALSLVIATLERVGKLTSDEAKSLSDGISNLIEVAQECGMMAVMLRVDELLPGSILYDVYEKEVALGDSLKPVTSLMN